MTVEIPVAPRGAPWRRLPGAQLAVATVTAGGRTIGFMGGLAGAVVRPAARVALRPVRREVSAALDVLVPAVVTEVLRRVDVAAALREYVDVDRVVAEVDIDAVIDRVDLVGLVNQVLDEIDLPEIIRDSTGSIGSETVRGIRMQGISADAAVDRALDRIRLRHQRGDSRVPGPAEPS